MLNSKCCGADDQLVQRRGRRLVQVVRRAKGNSTVMCAGTPSVACASNCERQWATAASASGTSTINPLPGTAGS